MEKVIAVSACLLGCDCKYNGKNNLDPLVIEAIRGKKVVPICPEVLGGMGTPRIPSEIQPDGSVHNKNHEDVTAFFEQGKKAALAILEENHCTEVILKDGSPSCGFKTIYDGTFTGRRISGMGITAKHFKDNGIRIVDIHKQGQR